MAGKPSWKQRPTEKGQAVQEESPGWAGGVGQLASAMASRAHPSRAETHNNKKERKADMADKVANGKTSLSSEEVIVRAVQFFSTEKFKATSQSGRTATFEGRPPIPWGMLLLTILGFLFCIVPGIIMYVMIIRKMHRFYSLVVTASPIAGGTEVSITYPDFAGRLVPRFLGALAPLAADGAPPSLP